MGRGCSVASLLSLAIHQRCAAVRCGALRRAAARCGADAVIRNPPHLPPPPPPPPRSTGNDPICFRLRSSH